MHILSKNVQNKCIYLFKYLLGTINVCFFAAQKYRNKNKLLIKNLKLCLKLHQE